MLVVINNLPLARSEQPEYQAQEGGFAAAVGPGYGKEVTSVYGKIYIIKNKPAVAHEAYFAKRQQRAYAFMMRARPATA